MRELLLLASIVLGGLAPNSHVYTQVTEKLRLAPQAATAKSAPANVAQIIARPTKMKLEDYTATAQAVYSIDLTSNEVLTSKDTDKRLQVASTTKLMTAYIILKEEKDLNRVLTVTNLAPQPGDAVMGLANGDRMSILGLLNGLLIPSGSDAAQTLAVGNSGSVSAFVAKMNAYAVNLKLTNTHYANPVGWDDAANYSSARDLTELARILIRDKTFAEIVSTKSKTVTTVGGRNIPLATTNQLLYSPGYVGVKTGYTYGAGECLVSLYKDGNQEILTTVLGSTNRFGETDSIKGWILGAYLW